jgi:acetyl-CoA C-acetyltransferase
METYYFGERELFRSRSTTEAAKRAYSMAGIKNPTDEIDVVEISAHFAHQEPILVEALGLFDEGSADRVIEDGLTEFDGKIPVNLSGGSLCANPLCATGMVRIVEVAMQLRGEADNYQLKNPSVGIAHSQDGICAQHNAVLVLSN